MVRKTVLRRLLDGVVRWVFGLVSIFVLSGLLGILPEAGEDGFAVALAAADGPASAVVEEAPSRPAVTLGALEKEIRAEFPVRDDVQQAFREIAARFTDYAVRNPTSPDTGRARALAAEVLLLGGDRRGALGQWNAMVDLGPGPDDRARGLFLLGSHRMLRGRLQEAGATFKRLGSEYPDSLWASSVVRSLKYLELQRTRDVPELSQVFRRGEEEVRLTTESLDGKITMIYFWRSSTPKHGEFVETVARDPRASIDQALKEYPILEGKLVVLGVNLDRDPGVYEAAMKRLAVPWPQAFDGKGFATPLAEAFAVVRCPQWLVVGPRRRIWYLGPDVQKFYTYASEAMKRHRVALEAAQEQAGERGSAEDGE